MENTQGQSSALEQYTQQYGQRLQSLLQPNSVTDTSVVLGRPTEPPQSRPQGAPLEQLVPPQNPVRQPAPRPAQTSALEEQPQPDVAGKPAGQGASVKKVFGDLPESEQNAQLEQLDAALKKGNQSIDSAYDELMKQMGTRPDDGITRREKGLVLIEFGLNMMANSSRPVGEAVGLSGQQAAKSYDQAKYGEGRAWDQKRSALEDARSSDKLGLSKLAAEEGIKAATREPKGGEAMKPQLFASGDGFMYQNIGGKAEIMRDQDGKPIKATQKDLDNAAGGKPTDFEIKYALYMEVNGKGPDGKPLSGDAMKALQNEAMNFAIKARDEMPSDAEIRQNAEKAVDMFMGSFWDKYRDMTPDELESERRKLVDERVRLMKQGLRADAGEVPPPSRDPRTLGPTFGGGGGSQFPSLLEDQSPPAEALVEGKARRIKGYEGRWTLVGGKPTRVD